MSELAGDAAQSDFWGETLDFLYSQGQVGNFELALLKQAKNLGLNGNTVVLTVPGEMVKTLIETKLREGIIEQFNAKLGIESTNLLVMIDESLLDAPKENPASAAPLNSPLKAGDGLDPGNAGTRPSPDSATPTGATTSTGENPANLGTNLGTENTKLSGGANTTGNPNNPTASASTPTTAATATTQTHSATATSTQSPSNRTANGLNPRYTFDSFVIGSSNSFTAAAAEAVVVNPAQTYNPLFIYGGPGLGKTHLLHAIGNYALVLNPKARVQYVSSEAFTNEFINAVAGAALNSFKAKYREVDYLLIDDIQFLKGKKGTLEEFFHTFNTLHTAGKQVVITSDVPPKELDDFEERLISRLEWGLLTDIQPPNLETRIAILRKKARQEGMVIPDEVTQWIASNVFSNIRELEGALIRVTAFSSLSGQPVTLRSAQEILRDFVTGKNSREITPKMIIEFTAKYFGIQAEEIMSPDRSRTVVGPRQVAMYLCRELTDLSLPKVGEAFGGRDHTTVMHAVKKIAKSMNEDSATYDSVTEITNDIRRTVREN